ncbi:M56 family metallopeptidase [Tenacibaculum sp. FZY0031]|uniref:M56 family metallopeptidase n=1 Tax=Tenacibaculum sp. FZY0031 TaxID=3116648 RepID=UPI002EC74144|nr:M56 family metallopeptidase [Tenacibaculum sp. FZY0031]
MITYLIKSGLCLALLLAFYHLVLEREKMHQFNRFYLLGSLLFSFIAPFYKIYIETIPNTVGTTATLITDSTMNANTGEEINYTQYLFVGYTIVAIILLIRFTKNLLNIFLKIKRHQKIKKGKTTLVLVDDAISPHTFWNYIFINKEEYNSNKIEIELYTHELTHALQKHTFDILLIELLQIIFWINPTFIFLKKAIKLNHEFLADNKVITTHKNTTEYQYLLLNRATWNNEYYLASNLNYVLTKKRLLMMTKQSSRTKILLKKLTVIPVLAGFTFLFAERVEAQKKDTDKAPVSIQVKNSAKNLKGESSKETLVVYTYEDGSTIQKKYDDLTLEERKQLPPPPPPKKGVYRRTPPAPNSPVVRIGEESNIPPPPPLTRVKKGGISHTPPPPPHIRIKKGMRTPPEPISPLEYIKKHKDNNSEYYYNGKKISYKKALKLLKSDNSINLHNWNKNDKAVFKLSDKPITIKN